DDLHAALERETESGDGAYIAKALDDGGTVLRLHFQEIHGALYEEDDAASGGLAPPGRTADRDWLPGDDLRHGVALVHRPGIHEPRHHLLVRPHVRTDDVRPRSDKGDHLLHIAPREPL